MSGKRWNELIEAINNNVPADKVVPPMNEKERASFYRMEDELKRLRARYGKNQKFAPVEIESDDDSLDIYSSEA